MKQMIRNHREIESLGKSIVFNKSTNTVEIGTNTEIDGDVKINSKVEIDDKSKFNGDVEFNGSTSGISYNDLENKPDIPDGWEEFPYQIAFDGIGFTTILINVLYKINVSLSGGQGDIHGYRYFFVDKRTESAQIIGIGIRSNDDTMFGTSLEFLSAEVPSDQTMKIYRKKI